MEILRAVKQFQEQERMERESRILVVEEEIVRETDKAKERGKGERDGNEREMPSQGEKREIVVNCMG